MAIERARAQTVQKPWGVADLRPWSRADHDGGRLIGEIWYERSGSGPSVPSLLLKLLFTSQPLSIQVHPDDAYARSIGLPCGKTEAWYIMSAAPGARIALGLKERLAPRQLREAINDGSLAKLVAWRTVLLGDVVFVGKLIDSASCVKCSSSDDRCGQRTLDTNRQQDKGYGSQSAIERGVVAD